MAVKVDENGFLKYEDTTFFREGVFDYAGCEIDPQGKLGLNPKKIYKVYRPKSEITKKEFVETLNQKPLVDDHTIIGSKPGMMAPERKNCAGVLSDVKVVGNELHGRLDIWSTKMISKIRSGKRELSLAYGCSFIPQKGVFKGERYDFVQSELRAGNHLALVDEARNGHDCRVVDCAFICDSKFQLEQPDMDWKTISADDLINGLKECSDEAKAKAKEFLNTPTEDELKKPTSRPLKSRLRRTPRPRPRLMRKPRRRPRLRRRRRLTPRSPRLRRRPRMSAIRHVPQQSKSTRPLMPSRRIAPQGSARSRWTASARKRISLSRCVRSTLHRRFSRVLNLKTLSSR